jgi:signal transduction histidine kinase
MRSTSTSSNPASPRRSAARSRTSPCDADQGDELLGAECGHGRQPLDRIARGDPHLRTQRLLALDDVAGDVFGQALDEEHLAHHHLVDRLLEQLGEARHVHALLFWIEIDETVDFGRHEDVLAAVLHPHRLLHSCYSRARETDAHVGRRGLEVRWGRYSLLHPSNRSNVAAADDRRFAQLVTLACHDLRNPLAIIYGFARALTRTEQDERTTRFVTMIDDASHDLGELLDELALVARIEAGRFAPELEETDSLGLVRAAASELADERLVVSGEGALVRVPASETKRALARLAKAAARHGGHESVAMVVHGAELELSPVSRAAAPVVLGEEVRELSAAAAVALVQALGGSLALEGERVRISLPAA